MTRIGLFFSLLAFSCGGGGAGAAKDPRCTSLCQNHASEIKWGSYCSDQSAQLCADNCSVRIEGVGTVCQSCLLEGAHFYAGESFIDTQCDGSTGMCTATGNGKTCSYPSADMAQRDSCLATVSPPKAVECTPSFRDVTTCSMVCGKS